MTEPKTTSPEPFVGVQEAADHLGYSKEWVYKKVQSDEIPYYQAGRGAALRFRVSELDEWLQGGQRTGDEA